MAFIKVSKCLSEPKYFIRVVAILICVCIATYQLSGCINKVLHPPTSTHNSFKLNQTMNYPALTVCRNPGFQTEKFAKFGLTDVACAPSFTSFWKEFDFKNFTLDQFFQDTTYGLQDVIPLHGFDGKLKSLEIQEITKLSYGKCFKFTPQFLSDRWEKVAGYSLYMMANPSETEMLKTPAKPPMPIPIPLFKEESKYGFHVFIHEPSERISDDGDQSDSFMEYIYVETENDLKYSLTASEYRNLPSKDNGCRSDHNYSKSMCKELCLADVVTKEVGCSAPWLENKMYPRCETYEKVKSLIKTYNEYSKRSNTNCNCPRSCNMTIYVPLINEAKRLNYPFQSAFSLYYLSNLVTVTEEIAVYDWSLFISDLGGSLGFLLGLSVLGLISMMEQILKMCFTPEESKNASKDCASANITDDNQQRALVLWQQKTYLNLNDNLIYI